MSAPTTPLSDKAVSDKAASATIEAPGAHSASPVDQAPWELRFQDGVVLGVMVVLAAACIVYEYLLSHYAGRVLGLMEHAIFTMIGVMIVAMGIGSLAAKRIRDPDTGFLVVELGLAVIGSTGILVIAGLFAFAADFPQIIGRNFGLPGDAAPTGGLTQSLESLVSVVPYAIGAMVGALIGMEIPLIARVRERIYAAHLAHNTGTVYGMDYIGAGIGAGLFIAVLLALPPEKVSVGVAAVNLLAGAVFLALRWKAVKWPRLFAALHGILFLGLMVVGWHAGSWHDRLENSLYRDTVVFSKDTDFQHLTVTRKVLGGDGGVRHSLYLNGRLQFCSCDEAIYHGMLVAPAMLASARTDQVLLIGGGDGLALRNILRWNPEAVTVLELDREMVRLFSEPVEQDGKVINGDLLALTEGSFQDPRVEVVIGDAYNTVDDLLADNRRFDVILVDLPDPSHPDLNKLYSTPFYARLRGLLAGDGTLAVQSTSPFHAKDAFLTIGVTLRAAGFGDVARLRTNVPSFGEWGFTLAGLPQGNAMDAPAQAVAAPAVLGRPLSQRIAQSRHTIPEASWASADLIQAAQVFPKDFFNGESALEPNGIGRNRLYRLYRQSWSRDEIAIGSRPGAANP